MGPSQNTSTPFILCFSSSLKRTIFDAHFLSCFSDVKTPTKWKMLAT